MHSILLKIKRIKPKAIRFWQKTRANRLQKIVGQGSYIPPEVSDDDFAYQITKIVSRPEVKVLIEVGSSSGEGSTSAILRGLKKKQFWTLHLLEVDPLRIELLRRKFLKKSGIFIHQYSSVSIFEYPSSEEVSAFYNSFPTNLNRWPLATILLWLEEDKQKLLGSDKSQINGINQIKKDFDIDYFDFALIDGSEFTGFADLRSLVGAKYILLDDINAFKCHKAYKSLKEDSSYILEYENWNLRNGFAIFSRGVLPLT